MHSDLGATSVPDYQSGFASALLDPFADTPIGLLGRGGTTAAQRYNVYRNNVTVSLIDALASIYPAVQRITGVEFFRAMARFHVRATPPASPLLFEYGRDFPSFIGSYEYAATVPWLADVARVERAWLDAYHAEDDVTLVAADLAEIAPDRLADVLLRPHPAACIVRSCYPAVSIFSTNKEPFAQSELHSGSAEDALITRPLLDVTVQLLPPGGAVFLSALINGATLGTAVGRAFEETPAFDLSTNLTGMIEAGVFASIKLRDPL